MNDNQIIKELTHIRDNFDFIISELKTRNGIIKSEILDLIDDINHLSVEV